LQAEVLLLPNHPQSSAPGVECTNYSCFNMHINPMRADAACSPEIVAENLANFGAETASGAAVSVETPPDTTIEVDPGHLPDP
jgi:hypothetical protein